MPHNLKTNACMHNTNKNNWTPQNQTIKHTKQQKQ